MGLLNTTRPAILAMLRDLERRLGVHRIPSLRLDDFDQLELLRYLQPIREASQKVGFGVGSYANDSGVVGVANGYYGAVYSPTQNRIYLVPSAQGVLSEWHYIDCDTGAVVAYTHGVTAVEFAYAGGVYSPTENRIYLSPQAQCDESAWHYIQSYSDVPVSRNLMAGALFNKF